MEELAEGYINKNYLTAFIVDEWKSGGNRKPIGGKMLYVTSHPNCWKIIQDGFEGVEELMCTHEEADTRLLVPEAHVVQCQYKVIIAHSEDTDVCVLCVCFSSEISVPLFQRYQPKNKVTYVDISKVFYAL